MKIYNDYDDLALNQLYCNAGVAVLGSAVVGGISSAFGASKAAKGQKDAALLAQQTAMKMYNQTREDLAPYRNLGENASKELENRMPYLTSDIDVTDEIRDPDSNIGKAYNFTRTQGLKAVQNAAAARGLGVSGAALKGASTFATGLADNTYQNLVTMERNIRGDIYSRLKGVVDTGVTAAAGTGTAGTAAAKQAGDAAIGAGNAEAAKWNTIGGAVANAASNIGGYATYKGIYGNKPNSVDMMPSNI